MEQKTHEYLDKAAEIALDRIDVERGAATKTRFDESLLPYGDTNKVHFFSVSENDVLSALEAAKAGLPEIFEARKNFADHRISRYPWTLPEDYSFHCECEMFDTHLEVEQSLHMYAGTKQYLEEMDEDIEIWLVYKARDYAFYYGTASLQDFLENHRSICACRGRTKLDFWRAACMIAMHSGTKSLKLHELFVVGIDRDIPAEPSVSYYLARFEDFRASHGLVSHGQILGSFAVLENGKAVFRPPIEDVALADKLRAKFGVDSVESHRLRLEKLLNTRSLPWEL